VSPLGVTLLVTAIAAAIVVALVALGRSREHDPGRPWWQHAPVWVGVSAVFALVGLFVAPRLFGFTFVFLPFLWMRGGRRQHQRTNDEHDADA
jgi:uncharacterized membrane protein YhaH (DUF805 family)